MFSFFDLPNELIIKHIFSKCETGDLLNAGETCKVLQQINLDNFVWKQRIKKNLMRTRIVAIAYRNTCCFIFSKKE
jgi:hypothetical protein